MLGASKAKAGAGNESAGAYIEPSLDKPLRAAGKVPTMPVLAAFLRAPKVMW
jgi:hypothetical protein